MRFEPTRDNMAIILDSGSYDETPVGVAFREHSTGIVVAIGPGREEYDLAGQRHIIAAPANVGDRVLVTNGYHCDKPITVDDGKKMIVVISACILAIIKE